jgi:two-component system sensor histidine kinase KdpD
MLYEINKKLLAAYDIASIRQVIEDHLAGIYGKDAVLYAEDPFAGGSAENSEKKKLCENESSVVHWVFANGKVAGAGTETLSLVPAFYVPVPGRDRVIGVIGVGCDSGKRLTRDNREFLGRLASLVALALERQTLSDRQRSMEIESEKEKMRYDFLRGISHDLRTPLTAILGASSVLLDTGELLDSEARYLFASDIRCDAQWLMRMVENILSVTKISDGSMRIMKKSEAVEEVVAEAASLVRSHFSGIHLNVSIPEDLLLVPMDGTLIEQVLINFMENAVKYAGVSPTIELRVTADAGNAYFTVIDDGSGIPEEDLPRIFDGPVSASRKNGDGTRGLGIGLMICAAIIKAHDGTISARNREGRGAEFCFTLPLGQGVDDGEQVAGTDR